MFKSTFLLVCLLAARSSAAPTLRPRAAACVDVGATPEFNNSLSGMIGHRLETTVFGVTNAQCNAICEDYPALWGIQYSAEIQYGGQNECVCFGNMTTPLSSMPTSTACGPCSNPPGANETCGQANAMNGYILGAPLEPVANPQPQTTCMGFGSTGPTGVDNTWGGRLQINTGNPSINDARSCNAFCSQTSGNTHSSMVQIGGQLGCVCAKLNSTDLASMTASSACAACEVIPPRIPAPVLGTCGMENAMNGAISALALVPVNGSAPITPVSGCFDVGATPEFNNSLSGMIGHRLETTVFGVGSAQCNAICEDYPALWGIQYSAEIQYGGQNECVCFGNMTTPLSSIPASTACGPCSNPPGANETCGQANAMNGYIIGAPLEPVANTQPATTCMGFGSTGPTGVDNTWGGRLQINTGNPSINDARSCNAFCSQTSGNTHSSMVQIGGQLGCVCAKLNSTDLSSMTASSACAACEVIPPRIPAPVLGTCGMENAQNGAISALALVPVSGTSPSPIVPTPTATSTGSVGQTSAATTASASATATTSAPAQSTTSRPNGAGRTAAGMGAAVALVFAALL